MGTCHKCAAALGRGTQKHAQCPTCGLLYHVTDCGGRYAACPDLNVPLDACPKVRRRSIFIFDFDLDFWTFDLPHPNFPEVRTLIVGSKNSINRDPTHFEWIPRVGTRKHH